MRALVTSKTNHDFISCQQFIENVHAKVAYLNGCNLPSWNPDFWNFEKAITPRLVEHLSWFAPSRIESWHGRFVLRTILNQRSIWLGGSSSISNQSNQLPKLSPWYLVAQNYQACRDQDFHFMTLVILEESTSTKIITICRIIESLLLV